MEHSFHLYLIQLYSPARWMGNDGKFDKMCNNNNNSDSEMMA